MRRGGERLGHIRCLTDLSGLAQVLLPLADGQLLELVTAGLNSIAEAAERGLPASCSASTATPSSSSSGAISSRLAAQDRRS